MLGVPVPREKEITITPGSAEVYGLTNGVLAFLIHRLPLIMFGRFHSGSFLARLLFRGGRRAGGYAAGHGEQEHGEDCRRHNGREASLMMTVFGVAK